MFHPLSTLRNVHQVITKPAVALEAVVNVQLEDTVHQSPAVEVLVAQVPTLKQAGLLASLVQLATVAAVVSKAQHAAMVIILKKEMMDVLTAQQGLIALQKKLLLIVWKVTILLVEPQHALSVK